MAASTPGRARGCLQRAMVSIRRAVEPSVGSARSAVCQGGRGQVGFQEQVKVGSVQTEEGAAQLR